MLSSLKSANTISICFRTLALTPSLWEGAVMNPLRRAIYSVVPCISRRSYPLLHHSSALQQDVNSLLLHHRCCPSLRCRLVSHLREKRSVKILTSGLFLKSNDDFPYVTSVQLPNNIVNSWGKGRKRLIPSHLH